MEIINATKADAPLIAEAVMTAVGEDICRNMAGKNNTIDDVRKIFTLLAESDESQYSWQNSRIIITDNGEKAGVCVSYPGSHLKKLRRSFFRLTNKFLGWNLSEEEIENIPEETVPEEFYLDSLIVVPEFRGEGYVTALIQDALEKAKSYNLPLGLLVDEENENAKRLYEKSGFKKVGDRYFAGNLMSNLRLT